MFWHKYVPVAQRRAKAARDMAKRQKDGKPVHPVVLEGRKIASSFWGKGWCEHLESFSDFENRLPRGRTYIRNGSVVHLDIQEGNIEAIVSGSSLYNISIKIDPLPKAKWKALKAKCAGQIGSMLELLQGRFSANVMAIVADRDEGLFPKPKEIHLRCDCPDWAVMCKHVAASLYGVGSRLDTQPELLFKLRGVDPAELLSAEMALAGAATGAETLADTELEGIFGVELEEEPIATKSAARKTPAKQKAKAAPKATLKVAKPKAPPKGKPAKTAAKKPVAPKLPVREPVSESEFTAVELIALRQRLRLSPLELANELKVSVQSVYRWEKLDGPIRTYGKTMEFLQRLRKRARY